MISAASHHFSLPAMAFKITSYIFITRSISAAGNCCSMASTSSSFSRPPFERTIHLLIEADNSHATDTGLIVASLNGLDHDILKTPRLNLRQSDLRQLYDFCQGCSGRRCNSATAPQL